MVDPQQQDKQPSSEQSPGDDSEHGGATRDPKDSAEALSGIDKRLQESTYRLADLNVLLVESAGETPGGEVLQAEFYFGRPVIRSAVIHRCASAGGRQYALAWLFEQAEPDPHVHLPAGEVTVSANGKVYPSAGCPIDYPFRPQATTVNDSSTRAGVEAPEAGVARTISSPGAMGASMPVPLRHRARLVWLPLCLLVILAASVLVYRNLIAPVPTTSETAAARGGREPPTIIAVEQENRFEPELIAATPEPPSLPQTEEPVRSEDEPATSERQPAALARHAALSQRSARASRPPSSERNITASERQRMRRPDAGNAPPPRSPEAVAAVQAPPGRGPTVAAGPTANVPSPATAEPPIAVGGTRGDGLETNQPLAKQQPPSPVIAREEQPAPPVIAREEHPQPAPAPAVQRPRQRVAVENTWLARMRADLVVCGKPGFWRNDICRERTRWRYCHPDRWHTVAECGVESFR